MADVRTELENALNKYFVALTFRADDGTETEVPMCWIQRVGRTKFDFKPSAIHLYTGTIARVISVKRTFPEGVEETTEARGRAEEVLERISQPLDRPSPQTYGDWVNLAENIKSADPASWTAAWVNSALQHISEEDPAAEASKRKLMQRASELGIR